MVIPFSLSVTSHLYGYMFDCAIVFIFTELMASPTGQTGALLAMNAHSAL